ncbi:hypothetical protein FQA47_005218 [Oryzias melastigma]|uniref:Uncharacterized protein n=1 Tax=Oryzias melastigma TaxID=30732 RepID=A0A834FES8_ORYME|nr:hypothetical protein FQA47_005218 [Oryzias melastigma]
MSGKQKRGGASVRHDHILLEIDLQTEVETQQKALCSFLSFSLHVIIRSSLQILDPVLGEQHGSGAGQRGVLERVIEGSGAGQREVLERVRGGFWSGSKEGSGAGH